MKKGVNVFLFLDIILRGGVTAHHSCVAPESGRSSWCGTRSPHLWVLILEDLSRRVSHRGRYADVTRTSHGRHSPGSRCPHHGPERSVLGGMATSTRGRGRLTRPAAPVDRIIGGGGGTGGRLEERKDSFLLYFLAFDELYNLLEPLVANISSKFLRLTRHIYIYRPVGESQAALKFPGPHETVFLLSFIFTSHNGCNNVTCFSAAFERVPLTRHLNVG